MPLEAALADRRRNQKYMVIKNRYIINSLHLLAFISISIGLSRISEECISSSGIYKAISLDCQ
jgi:hypothetical protein